jgi:phosphoribosylformylglycinamidine synthase I
MRFGIVVFPGSNGDDDVRHVVERLLGHEAVMLWHASRELSGAEVLVLPGGFSFGDHLRGGALAARSPVMDEVRAFARRGGPVLGICNGFQVLLEAGLLPGAMRRNRDGRFVSDVVPLVMGGGPTRFTSRLAPGSRLSLPIAHAEGCYTTDEETLARLEGEGQIVLRYAADGDGAASPNGSMGDVAGLANAGGNVVGLMPHPERACEPLLGGTAGLAFFESVLG